MRLVNFLHDGVARLGICQGDEILDVSGADPKLTDLVACVVAGASAWDKFSAYAPQAPRHSLADATLLAPIQRPGKIICLGLNYSEHAAETGNPRPQYPVIFLRTVTSLVGPNEPMVRPLVSEQFDYEGELVAVVNRTARHVKADQALSIIAGYSIFNDGSVRDYQRRGPQWTLGKNFDKTGAFGPVFVTADELPPGGVGLDLQTRLNGQVVQSSNTNQMLFSVIDMVVAASECMTLEAGDLLVMGTPSGVGAARKPPLWMKHGDVCEVEIARIGCLRNPIVDEAA